MATAVLGVTAMIAEGVAVAAAMAAVVTGLVPVAVPTVAVTVAVETVAVAARPGEAAGVVAEALRSLPHRRFRSARSRSVFGLARPTATLCWLICHRSRGRLPSWPCKGWVRYDSGSEKRTPRPSPRVAPKCPRHRS
jgi:hypothetical protein